MSAGDTMSSAATKQPTDDRITVTLRDAARMSGLSRSTLLRRADDGQLKTVRVGGRRLVKVDSLRELVSGE
jgi:excisionase family DNA binding protein